MPITEKFHGTLLTNPDGFIGLGVHPFFQKEVEHVEFDPNTNNLTVVTSDDPIYHDIGEVSVLQRNILLTGHEVLVAHFSNEDDFVDAKSNREYTVPLVQV